MSSSTSHPDDDPDPVETEPSTESIDPMPGLLRELRLRRFQQMATIAPESDQQEPEINAAVEEPASQDLRASFVDLCQEEQYEAEDEMADHSGDALSLFSQQIQDAVDDLSQEVRRVGRELFKTSRVSERNQELFEASLRDIQRLTDSIARIPEQFDERSAEMMIQAKASLCRELFPVVDAMEASLAAASELLDRLRANAEQPQSGPAFFFPMARRLRQSLQDSVETMSRWVEGQRLLLERVKAALQSAGARVIECEGQTFNPALHRAVAVERRSDVQAGAIISCELKGYTLDRIVLRYAEVIVAKDEQDSWN
jgi:molecular chaperone GrpE (heat shock protein)